MITLPVVDPNFSSGPVPIIANMEDRGQFLFDSKLGGQGTGSTIQKVLTYCKDIRGCGAADYRSVSAAITLNYLDNCVPRLNGVLSVSGLFFQQASTANLADMWGVILSPLGSNLEAAAQSLCPVIGN